MKVRTYPYPTAMEDPAGSVASAKETALKLALATFKAPKKVMDSAVEATVI